MICLILIRAHFHGVVKSKGSHTICRLTRDSELGCMDTREINISVQSPLPVLRDAAKVCRVPVPDVDEFIQETILKALESGKCGAKFPSFFSSQAIGWRKHGASRSNTAKVAAASITTLQDRDGDTVSAVGSLPYLIDPERILIALEGLAMVDLLPARQREALIASMQGKLELPGITRVNFRKLVSQARENLRMKEEG